MREQLGRLAQELRAPGSTLASGPELWRDGQVGLSALIVAINLVGVAAVLIAAYLVVPLPAVGSSGHVRAVNAVGAAIYVVTAVPLGAAVGIWTMAPIRSWLLESRAAEPAEQRLVLLAPVRLFEVQVGLWFAASVAFGVLDGHYAARLGLYVAVTVAITGLATAACAYLLTERVLRPAAVRALSGFAATEVAGPGVATRSVLAWALGSGLLLLAVVGVGVGYLAGNPATAHQLAVAMTVLAAIGIAVGLLASSLAARATASPIDAVTRALERVERGDLDTKVAVYDGTQVGRLQQGFNEMVNGLAERERIRQAFGTYVDPELGERILREGVRLDGEEMDVTVMFVDVRGFTAFAERTPAHEVVHALNELFGRIVPVVHAHQGRVDKFIGDGLMAVFGAPRRLDDHAAQALDAAIEIAELTGPGSGVMPIGIGLNSGMVVAGNIGGAGRLEYGVIGDTVNVAARVEQATRVTGDTVLISGRTRELAGAVSYLLTEREGVALKGKTELIRLYAAARVEPQ